MEKERTKNRQKRGTGGLQRKNGKYEGRYRVYKQDGSCIEKSFTRPTAAEINDIKAGLRVLGVIDNDVIGINIDKHTNTITLQRQSILSPSNSKIQVGKDILVDDYVDYWLWNHRRKGMKKQMIKDSTFEDYVQKCQHIKKRLGSIKLENGKTKKLKVRELTFTFMELQMLELHKEVEHTTAVQVRNHVYNMMKYAKKDGIIEVNPFQDEEINFPEARPKKEKKVIKENDVGRVIKYCIKIWYIDVLTQLMIGARGGEIKGLRWVDIDENLCQITLFESYNSVKQFKLDESNHIVSLGRKRRESTLKSKYSQRTIDVGEELIKVLMVHKFLQKKLAEKNHKEFKETDKVFTTNKYNPLGRNTLNERVKKVVKDLEVENYEEITSHCLRHGFCYAGLLNDVPLEYMQILLGHSNIAVTRQWYAHFDKSKINDYAKKVNTNRTAVLQKLQGIPTTAAVGQY